MNKKPNQVKIKTKQYTQNIFYYSQLQTLTCMTINFLASSYKIITAYRLATITVPSLNNSATIKCLYWEGISFRVCYISVRSQDSKSGELLVYDLFTASDKRKTKKTEGSSTLKNTTTALTTNMITKDEMVGVESRKPKSQWGLDLDTLNLIISQLPNFFMCEQWTCRKCNHQTFPINWEVWLHFTPS